MAMWSGKERGGREEAGKTLIVVMIEHVWCWVVILAWLAGWLAG